MAPLPRPARPKSARAARAPRPSTGPLSAAAMATFRCPTRADFLHEVRSPPRARAKSFAAGERGRGPARAPHGARDEEEEIVPAHQSVALLDALDRLEEFAELKAIVIWLDDLRTRRGFTLRITDMDLSNGIALLDALYIIDSALFADIEYGEAGGVGVPRPYVERVLDEEGGAARRNIARLRALLAKFAWREVDGDGRRLPPINFEAVDVWALGGFVVVAAFTCEDAPHLVAHMSAYDNWVQNELEDVVFRGMQALGAGAPMEDGLSRGEGTASTASMATGDTSTRGTMSGSLSTTESGSVEEEVRLWRTRTKEAEQELQAERALRMEAEQAAENASSTVDAWATTVEGLNEELSKVKDELRKERAEGRRLKGGAVLRDTNGGKGVGMMQVLRSENARLRRRVAELERVEAIRERDKAKKGKEARKGAGVKSRGSA